MPTGWTSRDTGCYDRDTNYTIDKTTLSGANIWKTGQEYWLASRSVTSRSSDVSFYGGHVDASGDMNGDRICAVYSDGDTYGMSDTYGLRPCISLKSSIIRITGGDGTSEDTAYTIGI